MTVARRLAAGALASVALLAPLMMSVPTAGRNEVDLLTIATQPIAVGGGVLMLPLSPAIGQALPQRVPLRLQDGRVIDGVMAIMTAGTDSTTARRWTDDPRRLVLRELQRGETAAGEGSMTFLLARLPADAWGTIRFGTQTLEPRWSVMPPRPARESTFKVQATQVLSTPDRPDPDAPLEYWRWVLLADSMDLAPPSPQRYGSVGALAAEHVADLWRLGLERLRRADGEAAQQCTELLTRIGVDASDPAHGVVAFATWPVDPAALAALLATMLDDSLADAELAARARQWIEAQGAMMTWLEQSGRELVRVAVANRRTQPLLTKFTWPGFDDVPLGELIGPSALGHVVVERPGAEAWPIAASDGAATREPAQAIAAVLQVQAEGRPLLLRCAPDAWIAEPPGVAVGPLRPLLTLAEAQGVAPRPVEASRLTLIEVRRIGGRWEIFLDCRRPAIDPHMLMAQAALLAQLGGYSETAGIEAATLLIGRTSFDGGPRIALAIPEQGDWRLFKGAANAALEVHRRSHADRWLCRVVLPDAWLNPALEGPYLRLGAMRTHGDGDAIETAPNACVPWRLEPGRVEIDLSAWQELP